MKVGMKTAMGVLGGGLLTLLLTGCALFGADPRAPSRFEQAHYDIVTNFVTVTNVVAREVTVTNVELLTVTNTQNQVLVLTNLVPQVITLYNTNTVQKETWEYHANSNAAALTAGAARLGELSGIPGVGTIISLGGTCLWGLWGTLRSSGRGKALAVASQSLATAQQVLAQTPQGTRLSQELNDWLAQHHEVAGAAGIIDEFVDRYVDDANARASAHQILALAAAPPRPAS